MKKLYVVLAVVVVGVVAVSAYFVQRGKNGVPTFESVTVERGAVVNYVSVTGHVEPVTRLALAFSYGGEISSIAVHEGEQVSKGILIATLEDTVLRSALSEAEARVTHEHAVLQTVLAPLRTEERALKDASVASAERALESTEDSAHTTLARVFVSVDDAIHEGADELFTGTQGDSPTLGVEFRYGTTEYALRADAETKSILNEERAEVEKVLTRMEARVNDTTTPVDEMLVSTEQDLATIEDFLTTLASVVNKYKPTDVYDQSVYESFQLSVSTARVTVNSARSEVSGAYTAYTTAFSALSVALHDLELSTAGASSETIAAQEAAVTMAEAAVKTAQERVREVQLRAPVDGVVSRIDYKVGEMIGPYVSIAELITQGVYEVEAYIPEADIASVKLGNSAEITFDAFERTMVFHAEVVRMALSETMKEGVPTYKTTLRVLDLDEKGGVALLPGMTADIEILTDSKEDVLYIPVRSVLRDGDRTYVKVFNGTTFDEVDIETGLRSSTGTIEVTSGLKEGEEIVLYIEEA